MKKYMILLVGVLALAGCDNTEIVSDCSNLTTEPRLEMEKTFSMCLIKTDVGTCKRNVEDLYCEKRIVETNSDGAVVKIHRILDGKQIMSNEVKLDVE